MDTRNKVFVVVGTVAILAAAGVGGLVLFSQSDSPNSANGMMSSQSSNSSMSNPSPSATTGTQSNSSNTSTGYKDGTYSSMVNYMVPHGGQNSVKATVTISSGKISSVSTNDNYTDNESSFYIQSFESSVSSDATGQSIGDYSPSQIGGASLTTAAFARAIDDIVSQAKA